MNTSNDSNDRSAGLPSNNDEWTECDGCQLESLGARLRAQFLRKCGIKCCQKGAVVAVVALLIATPFLLRPATIPCEICVERFVPYHSHLVGNLSDPSQPQLSDAMLEEVRQHLESCEMCRGKFEQAYPGVLARFASLGSFAFLLIASLGVRRKWERDQ